VLNEAALSRLAPTVATPAYDRAAVSAGIVHFGAGAVDLEPECRRRITDRTEWTRLCRMGHGATAAACNRFLYYSRALNAALQRICTHPVRMSTMNSTSSREVPSG